MPNPKKYVDKLTKYLEDWQWHPLEQVSEKVGNPKEIPDYIQKGYGEFMAEQAGRSKKGEMTPRDLVKAFGITQSSIGRRGLPHSVATKRGLRVPNEGTLVRPEGAFAEWLGSPMGQRYLNAAERGEVDSDALRDIQEKFAPFGKHNQLAEQLAYGVNLPNADKINQALTGSVSDYRDWARQFKGINSAKTGFIGSLLGRGDLPTLDARQLYLQAPKRSASILDRGRGQAGLEAVDRLAARQTAMDMAVDPSLKDYYQHLAHHNLWDLVGGSQTTHSDLVKAMKNYAPGGWAKRGYKAYSKYGPTKSARSEAEINRQKAMAYAPADVPPELLQEYQALLANHRWDYQNTVPFGSDEFNKHYNNLERIGQLQRAIDPDSILFNDAWKTREAERMKKSGW